MKKVSREELTAHGFHRKPWYIMNRYHGEIYKKRGVEVRFEKVPNSSSIGFHVDCLDAHVSIDDVMKVVEMVVKGK